MNTRTNLRRGFWIAVFISWHLSSFAAFYNNQVYPGNGVSGTIGNGTLRLYNNATTVYANFTNVINGSFTDNLVMFIDCAPGGYDSTALFKDNGNALQSATSGYKTSRATANFAPGFSADYAIALSPNNSGSALYKLVDDGAGPYLLLIRSSLGLTPTDNIGSPVFYWQFDWTDIGLPAQKTNFFKFETSYVTGYGYRSLQSFEGLTGREGFNTVSFTNYDTYGVPPVPENTNLALGVFGGIAASVAISSRWRRRYNQRQACSDRLL